MRVRQRSLCTGLHLVVRATSATYPELPARVRKDLRLVCMVTVKWCARRTVEGQELFETGLEIMPEWL